MTKRYDELKQGDKIVFHGANVNVTGVRTHNIEGVKVISFDIEPADALALEMLGGFYGHGTYSGNADLKVELA